MKGPKLYMYYIIKTLYTKQKCSYLEWSMPRNNILVTTCMTGDELELITISNIRCRDWSQIGYIQGRYKSFGVNQYIIDT